MPELSVGDKFEVIGVIELPGLEKSLKYEVINIQKFKHGRTYLLDPVLQQGNPIQHLTKDVDHYLGSEGSEKPYLKKLD